MPLPNKDNVIGFFESYLNIRNNGTTFHKAWVIYDAHTKKVITSKIEKVRNKTAFCTEIVNDIKKAETEDDWKIIIYKLAYHEAFEEKNNHIWSSRWAGYTCRAAYAYILHELGWTLDLTRASDSYEAMKQKLSQFEEELKNKLAEAERSLEFGNQNPKTEIGKDKEKYETLKLSLNNIINVTANDRKYFEAYYNTIIQKYDSVSCELKEKSFNEFLNNIQGGKRVAIICNALVNDHNAFSKDNHTHDDGMVADGPISHARKTASAESASRPPSPMPAAPPKLYSAVAATGISSNGNERSTAKPSSSPSESLHDDLKTQSKGFKAEEVSNNLPRRTIRTRAEANLATSRDTVFASTSTRTRESRHDNVAEGTRRRRTTPRQG